VTEPEVEGDSPQAKKSQAATAAAAVDGPDKPTVEGTQGTSAADAPTDDADAPTDPGADGGADVADDAAATTESEDDVVVVGEVIDIDAAPEPAPAPGPADRIAALEARLKTVSAAYKAQVEEVEATKQRLTRQAAYKAERTRGEVVGTFFEPVENLRRAIEVVRKSAGDGASGEDAASGLDLVLQQFMEAFKKLGVEEVSGKGARFDPTQHEALTMMPVTDPALDGVVVEVFDTGYRIGSTLLKPARVIVGSMPDGEADA